VETAGSAERAETQELSAERRIIGAFGSMPYGAAAEFEHGDSRTGYVLTPEQVATNLERLRDVLTAVQATNEAGARELYEYKMDLAAVGRLMMRAQNLR